jgi:hypothetical protein
MNQDASNVATIEDPSVYEITYRGLMPPRLAPDNQESVDAGPAET